MPSTTANGRRGIESAERSGPQSRDRRYADVIALGQFREGRALSPATLLFGPDGTDQGQRRPKLWAAAAHSNGIASFTLTLRRKLTRLEFAMALGGLARQRGEDLLRVKGFVEFADRPGRPAELHAVQHTLYPPHWLDAWPGGDDRQQLVFIVRGISIDEILHWFSKAEPQVATDLLP